MKQLFLVAFRSHHEDPSDILLVDVRANSPLEAIREGVKKGKPDILLGQWVYAKAWPWPKDCTNLDEASEKYSVFAR